MSKLLKTAVASLTVLAALAFGASSAWADASDSLPDTVAANWTAVQVNSVGDCEPTAMVPCTVHAVSTNSVLDGGLANCNVDLTVDVYADGSTEITGSMIGGPGICPAIQGSQNYTVGSHTWLDQICQYTAGTSSTADDEYWDGIDVDFTVGGTVLVQGDIYGQLQATNPFARIDVDSDIGTGAHHIQADGNGASQPYVFEDANGNAVSIDVESVEGDCDAIVDPNNPDPDAWSELS